MGRSPLSPAHIFGGLSLMGAALLAPVSPGVSLLPLLAFVSACSIAPFLPRSSFFLPVVSRGRSGQKAVSVTFDDGPDPESTPPLLELLTRHGVRAAFFVNGGKAAEHPPLMEEILRKGHEVGNHTFSHDNLVMFKSSGTLMKEIQSTQDVLREFGIRPLAFRPPVGVTNPRLGGVLDEAGMYAINFSCRAIDGGNRWIKDLSARILKRVHPDAIVALHDVRPGDHALLSYWLGEIDMILLGIRTKGLDILPLSELIGRPVMERLPGGKGPGSTCEHAWRQATVETFEVPKWTTSRSKTPRSAPPQR